MCLQKIDVLLLFLCVQRCLIKILSDISKEGDAVVVVVVGLIHVTSICERLDNVLRALALKNANAISKAFLAFHS